MESILKNYARVGNFTSSKIVKLTTNGRAKDSFGAPFFDYIAERNMERRLNRSLSTEKSTPAFSWGKIGEKRVFDLLSIDHRLCSNDTLEHRTIRDWVGSPDFTKEELIEAVLRKIVGDVKCPLTMKSFCLLVEPIYAGIDGMDAINWVREHHDQGDDYFWQLVSNAIITGSDIGQLKIYCPYLSELPAIRLLAGEEVEKGDWNYNWIHKADDDGLPYLVDGGFYENLNTLEFPVTQRDKDFLTQRVQAGVERLIKRPDVYTKLLI
jgi:hypothetical protein